MRLANRPAGFHAPEGKAVAVRSMHPKQSVAERHSPILIFHRHESFFPCSVDWLLAQSRLRHTRLPLDMEGPGQAELAFFGQAEYGQHFFPYLQIDPVARTGQRLGEAPLYYLTQEWDDCLEIVYLVLYAFQGGQTARLAGQDWVLNDLGQHEGDLEWVSVLLHKDLHTVLAVGYAAHGHTRYHSPQNCRWRDGHPLVWVALNGHSSAPHWNPRVQFKVPGLFSVLDLFTVDGPCWQAAQLVYLPDQPWAAFQGRLGTDRENSIGNWTRLDGRPLPRLLQSLAHLAEGRLPAELRRGQATPGPFAPGREFAPRRQGGLFRNGPVQL